MDGDSELHAANGWERMDNDGSKQMDGSSLQFALPFAPRATEKFPRFEKEHQFKRFQKVLKRLR